MYHRYQRHNLERNWPLLFSKIITFFYMLFEAFHVSSRKIFYNTVSNIYIVMIYIIIYLNIEFFEQVAFLILGDRVHNIYLVYFSTYHVFLLFQSVKRGKNQLEWKHKRFCFVYDQIEHQSCTGNLILFILMKSK